jgi:hypothetical protein
VLWLDEDEQMFFFFKSGTEIRLARLYNTEKNEDDKDDKAYHLRFNRIAAGTKLREYCDFVDTKFG